MITCNLTSHLKASFKNPRLYIPPNIMDMRGEKLDVVETALTIFLYKNVPKH